ncbi:hypothetical protein LTR53_011111 [Teratosphaeriaceae sp. CCFEE 6253]|nr:hypothetical protein LTR53_011111 [Teratosphaeriaceae sp. CCFEE 6253]
MDDQGPSAKRTRLDVARSLLVQVGDEKQEFSVRSDLIMKRSPFFKAAADERRNDPRRPVVLDDDKPATFSAYLKCLHSGAVDADPSDDASLCSVVDVYVLADKLGDLACGNLVIDYLMALYDASYHTDFLGLGGPARPRLRHHGPGLAASPPARRLLRPRSQRRAHREGPGGGDP